MTLPVRAALQYCNQINLSILRQQGLLPIDGGAAKCKKLDSIFFDELKQKGFKGFQMNLMLEADWVISNTKNSNEFPNNDLVFTYINSNANKVVYFSLTEGFSIRKNKITATEYKGKNTYMIKVGRPASMNIRYIFMNQEEFK